MSLMAFSVRKTSLVRPRYLWAALNVTLEKRVRMTGRFHVRVSASSVTLQKRSTLDDVRGGFGELGSQTLERFCGYDRERGVLLCSGYNATVE